MKVIDVIDFAKRNDDFDKFPTNEIVTDMMLQCLTMGMRNIFCYMNLHFDEKNQRN